jgi:hypothetical protein
MNTPDADCKELVTCTAESLDRDALRLLIVSTLRNGIRDRIESAIETWVLNSLVREGVWSCSKCSCFSCPTWGISHCI